MCVIQAHHWKKEAVRKHMQKPHHLLKGLESWLCTASEKSILIYADLWKVPKPRQEHFMKGWSVQSRLWSVLKNIHLEPNSAGKKNLFTTCFMEKRTACTSGFSVVPGHFNTRPGWTGTWTTDAVVCGQPSVALTFRCSFANQSETSRDWKHLDCCRANFYKLSWPPVDESQWLCWSSSSVASFRLTLLTIIGWNGDLV